MFQFIQFENLWNILPVNPYGNLDFHEFLMKFSGNVKEFDDHVLQEGQGPTSPAPVSPDSKANILKRPKTASCSIRSSKVNIFVTLHKEPLKDLKELLLLIGCTRYDMFGFKEQPKPCW